MWVLVMRIFGKVSYLGTNYHGWQKQVNDSSIQEEIEKVLSTILNEQISIYGSGRTDQGVHAKGQTFHFDIDKNIDLSRLRYSVNMLLPKDIHILEFKETDKDFHARFSAKGKHYQYLINVDEFDPFLKDTTMYYPYKFDLNLFKKALELFKGKHDYKNFTSKEEDDDNFIREITSIEVTTDENLVVIDLIGNGFMRYMIRDLIGTALAISTGKESLDYIYKHLDTSKREITSYKADSNGLYLIEVFY